MVQFWSVVFDLSVRLSPPPSLGDRFPRMRQLDSTGEEISWINIPPAVLFAWFPSMVQFVRVGLDTPRIMIPPAEDEATLLETVV